MANEPRLLRWETLTKRRFDAIDRERAVVMVTCSPLEVHGPHLPLGADALEGAIDEYFRNWLVEQQAAANIEERGLVSDQIPVGAAKEAEEFRNSLSVQSS